MVCDEGHVLKNSDGNQIINALKTIRTRRFFSFLERERGGKMSQILFLDDGAKSQGNEWFCVSGWVREKANKTIL